MPDSIKACLTVPPFDVVPSPKSQITSWDSGTSPMMLNEMGSFNNTTFSSGKIDNLEISLHDRKVTAINISMENLK